MVNHFSINPEYEEDLSIVALNDKTDKSFSAVGDAFAVALEKYGISQDTPITFTLPDGF